MSPRDVKAALDVAETRPANRPTRLVAYAESECSPTAIPQTSERKEECYLAKDASVAIW